MRFLPLPPTLATDSVVLRWENDCRIVDQPLSSLTWYYGSSPDGRNRRRMASLVKDDFRQGLRERWRPTGAFDFDWSVRSDGQRHWVSAPPASGPCVSEWRVDQDSVISALLRPGDGGAARFGFRTSPAGSGYEVKFTKGAVTICEGDRLVRAVKFGLVGSDEWFWVEVGARRSFGRDIELRLRVYDLTRENALVSLRTEDRPGAAQLSRGGHVTLWGGADVAEVYADPWESRWVDDPKNQFNWWLGDAEDNTYYLFAEVNEDGARPVLVTSPFQVRIAR